MCVSDILHLDGTMLHLGESTKTSMPVGAAKSKEWKLQGCHMLTWRYGLEVKQALREQAVRVCSDWWWQEHLALPQALSQQLQDPRTCVLHPFRSPQNVRACKPHCS